MKGKNSLGFYALQNSHHAISDRERFPDNLMMCNLIGTFEHILEGQENFFKFDLRIDLSDLDAADIRTDLMDIPLEPWELIKLLRSRLELLVFLQSTDQVSPRILLFHLTILPSWQEESRLDFSEDGSHEEVFGGKFDIKYRHHLDVTDVLTRYVGNGYVDDREALSSYQVQEEIQWPLESLKEDLQCIRGDVEINGKVMNRSA